MTKSRLESRRVKPEPPTGNCAVCGGTGRNGDCTGCAGTGGTLGQPEPSPPQEPLRGLIHEILDDWHRSDEDDGARLDESLARLQTFAAGMYDAQPSSPLKKCGGCGQMKDMGHREECEPYGYIPPAEASAPSATPVDLCPGCKVAVGERHPVFCNLRPGDEEIYPGKAIRRARRAQERSQATIYYCNACGSDFKPMCPDCGECCDIELSRNHAVRGQGPVITSPANQAVTDQK